jgi:hypothetical protein
MLEEQEVVPLMLRHLLYYCVEQLSVLYVPQKLLVSFKHRGGVMAPNLFVKK